MDQYTVTFYPHEIRVNVPQGTTLLQAASRAGLHLNNVCGGDGICGRCKMVVTDGKVATEITGKLTREEIKTGFVLACLTTVQSDIIATIPEQTYAKELRVTDKEAERFTDSKAVLDYGDNTPAPLVRKVYLELEKPTLNNNLPDHQRICTEIRRKLGVASTQTGLKIIRALPDILRRSDYCVTATVGIRANVAELMYLEPGDTERRNFLAIVDMGTTTIVAHLADANTLETLGSKACFNSQGVFGREITGRLIAAERHGSDELQKVLVEDINRLVRDLTEENEVKLSEVTAVVCAGNTAMAHFLLGLPAEHIRREPYIATTVEPPPLRAAEVGININPRGLLYTLPGIGAWVGSDITAGILATRMHEQDATTMLVDIGTNGEVVVGNREWLMACSASAGPALEGASVECGIRAESGAIEKVYVEGTQVRYETIGNAPPKGICGSGIIDMVGVLLRRKLIDRSGKFVRNGCERIREKDGVRRYVLVEAAEDGGPGPIYMTETDIANIITAKAAIFAAIRILLKRLDLQFSDITRFYLAGAFGNYLDVENAMTIGLIPRLPRDRVVFVGNTSVQGSKIVALHRDAFDKIITIERDTTYYDLMGAQDYIEEFQKALFLPHTDVELFTAPEEKVACSYE